MMNASQIHQMEGLVHLVLLGLLAPNFHLHSITTMPDTSPTVQKMSTVKFKIPNIGLEGFK